MIYIIKTTSTPAPDADKELLIACLRCLTTYELDVLAYVTDLVRVEKLRLETK